MRNRKTRSKTGKSETVPAYMVDVLRAAKGVQPGGVGIVEVKHAPACDLLAGRGGCNCKPQVGMVVPS